MNDRTLSQALECLEPVSAQLVVVGGTAHRMFSLHVLGRDPGFELLTTEDVDLAAPLALQHEGGRELLDRLEAAGFTEELRGAEYATYTYHPRENAGSYLQFIAPLTGSGLLRDGRGTGSGLLRDGRRDRLMRFSGIHAEKLRHVDILLHRPWSVRVQAGDGELTLQVVNPIAFLVQKLLVLPNRGARRGKDLLYVFDTLTIFADALDSLGADAAELVPALSASSVAKLRRSARETCLRESEVSREAAAIAADQRTTPPDSKQIVGACDLGLRRVLRDLVPEL